MKPKIINEKAIKDITSYLVNGIWGELSKLEYMVNNPDEPMIETSIYPKGKYILLGMTKEKMETHIGYLIEKVIKQDKSIQISERLISDAQKEAGIIIREAENRAERLSLKNVVDTIENIEFGINELRNHLGSSSY